MAINLTTRFLAKLHMQKSLDDTDDDDLIDRIINEVSQAIAAYTDRTFEITTYRRWYDGTGSPTLLLPDFPITRLFSVSIFSVTAMRVSSTDKRASVIVKDGNLFLNRTDSSGNEATEVEIKFTDQKTINTLATAIAAESTWSATVESSSDEGDQSSQLIRPVDGGNAADPDDIVLEIADDPEEARVAAESNQAIEMVRANTFRSAVFRSFPFGKTNIFVHFKAGFTLPEDLAANVAPTTPGNVPEDLTGYANEMTKAVYQSTKQNTGGLKSEKIGNYSYTLGANAKAVIQASLMDNRDGLSLHRSMRLV